MYHAIVKRIALQSFLRVNQKDHAATSMRTKTPDFLPPLCRHGRRME
jgi:hypothetical protein